MMRDGLFGSGRWTKIRAAFDLRSKGERKVHVREERFHERIGVRRGSQENGQGSKKIGT